MIHGENNFTFSLNQQPTQNIATITVHSDAVNALYKEALLAQKAEAHTYGFSKGETPMHYIEHNFRPNILEHLKELLFNHCVINFLCQSLNEHKIVVVGEPTLIDINLLPNNDAEFIFGLAYVKHEMEAKWKNLSLRAPERKNYKDLDRQVEFFIKEELEKAQKHTGSSINIGDWVCFEMMLVDNSRNPLLNGYYDELWVKISDEEADRELHSLFLGKNIGDKFFTKSTFLQDYISNEFDMNYTFSIFIKDYVPHAFFSFDNFKRHFQLKNNKDMHHKLIEVFSYRNDLSQRRETVEATFKLLLKHYFVLLPNHLLEKQKKSVLTMVHANPDYNVYKAQSDFKEKVKLLAEKQLKEMLVIDTIAYQENITVMHDDIVGYLNLIKRPRTKEFIYHDLPIAKVNGQITPIPKKILERYILREKTTNYVIQNLTRKS